MGMAEPTTEKNTSSTDSGSGKKSLILKVLAALVGLGVLCTIGYFIFKSFKPKTPLLGKSSAKSTSKSPSSEAKPSSSEAKSKSSSKSSGSDVTQRRKPTKVG